MTHRLKTRQNVASLFPVRPFQSATFPEHGKGWPSISLILAQYAAAFPDCRIRSMKLDGSEWVMNR